MITTFRFKIRKHILSRKLWLLGVCLLFSFKSMASYILVPMDADAQKNHLKAYGIAYWTLEREVKIQWLLNYRGGSFLIPFHEEIKKECSIRGVSFEVISITKAQSILDDISSPSQNMEAVVLEKAPKIAVYSPKGIYLGMTQ